MDTNMKLAVLKQLEMILNTRPLDMDMAMDIYIKNIYDGGCRGEDRKVINRALLMFQNCWYSNKFEIKRNIGYLSNLAAIFCDENLFIHEYNDICQKIQELLTMTQTDTPLMYDNNYINTFDTIASPLASASSRYRIVNNNHRKTFF